MRHFGEPGRIAAPKLTHLYREPGLPTFAPRWNRVCCTEFKVLRFKVATYAGARETVQVGRLMAQGLLREVHEIVVNVL